MSDRYSIGVDFDGVIHGYTSPWVKPHIIPDPPVAGVIPWLGEMIQDFDIWIFSTRCKTWRGRRAVRDYIREHSGMLWWPSPASVGLEEIKTTFEKPPCLIYVDDRGYRFEGDNFPSVDEIRNLRPWNKRILYEGES